MEHFVWPGVVLILGILFILLFKKDISTLLGRTKKIGKGGIEIVSSELQKSSQSKSSTEELMRTFDSVSLLENEKRIKEDLEERKLADPQDKIDVLVRHLAVYQLSYLFERFNNSIFGSQISILQHLNSKSLGETAEPLEPFYANAAKKYPETYADYPFENYLSFLVTAGLLEKKDERYSVTALGRDFLIYLVNSAAPTERLS